MNQIFYYKNYKIFAYNALVILKLISILKNLIFLIKYIPILILV